MTDTRQPLLEVDRVTRWHPLKRSVVPAWRTHVKAVSNVSLSVYPGETLGIVGESGCGKSTLARTIVGLHKPRSGRVLYNGKQISGLSSRRMMPVRREVQLMFQDPFTSLNPRRRVGSIIAEPLVVHGVGDRAARRRRVHELLEMVGLRSEYAQRYPVEFSGGQRQRISLARALALSPRLLICDEPVSALDVSIQAQIVNLLGDLKKELGLTLVFIAHDLSVVRHVSDRVAVMYLGRLMEIGDADAVFTAPQNPYTAALSSATMAPDPHQGRRQRRILLVGDVPSPVDPPKGCVFSGRCPKVQPLLCRWERPLMRDASGAGMQEAACHYPLLPDELTSVPV